MSALEPLPEAPPPAAPLPSPKEFTQAELQTHDFTGWDYRQLPHDVWKAARNGANCIVAGKVECLECKRMVWSCNPKLEDLCDVCDFLLRYRNAELKIARSKREYHRPVNPWDDGSNATPTPIPWPLNR
ncbi:MAG TPA: hypothetical protein VKD24_07110 [Candidatus Angelobacter sp.]|nr:hypothetical protein [Candidatus Angelobacter sp.]